MSFSYIDSCFVPPARLLALCFWKILNALLRSWPRPFKAPIWTAVSNEYASLAFRLMKHNHFHEMNLDDFASAHARWTDLPSAHLIGRLRCAYESPGLLPSVCRTIDSRSVLISSSFIFSPICVSIAANHQSLSSASLGNSTRCQNLLPKRHCLPHFAAINAISESLCRRSTAVTTSNAKADRTIPTSIASRNAVVDKKRDQSRLCPRLARTGHSEFCFSSVVVDADETQQRMSSQKAWKIKTQHRVRRLAYNEICMVVRPICLSGR
ncbi:hypothetical protein IWZ03DRAFT_361408 [Phyllosticta citriasiana]|uniref:Uncharacterized protein n=1 Tax=Phyllosticta citriasiana TaxID=595635 RepID=A0ABR1KK51_9PEZI